MLEDQNVIDISTIIPLFLLGGVQVSSWNQLLVVLVEQQLFSANKQ